MISKSSASISCGVDRRLAQRHELAAHADERRVADAEVQVAALAAEQLVEEASIVAIGTLPSCRRAPARRSSLLGPFRSPAGRGCGRRVWARGRAAPGRVPSVASSSSGASATAARRQGDRPGAHELGERVVEADDPERLVRAAGGSGSGRSCCRGSGSRAGSSPGGARRRRPCRAPSAAGTRRWLDDQRRPPASVMRTCA